MNEDSNSRPQKLKMDIKTPVEQFFMVTAILSLCLIFIGYMQLQSGWPATLMIGAAIVSALSFLCYFSTNNYYILDIEQKKLFYHFSFMLIKDLREMCNFDEIASVTVNTTRMSGKGKTTYFYSTQLLLADGTVLDVSDPQLQKHEAAKLARFISEATGAEYVVGGDKAVMITKQQANGKVAFTQKNESSKSGALIEKIIAVIMILLGIPFIAAVVYHLIKR